MMKDVEETAGAVSVKVKLNPLSGLVKALNPCPPMEYVGVLKSEARPFDSPAELITRTAQETVSLTRITVVPLLAPAQLSVDAAVTGPYTVNEAGLPVTGTLLVTRMTLMEKETEASDGAEAWKTYVRPESVVIRDESDEPPEDKDARKSVAKLVVEAPEPSRVTSTQLMSSENRT